MMILQKSVWSCKGGVQVHAMTCKPFKVGPASLHCTGKQTHEQANSQIKLKVASECCMLLHVDWEYHLDVRDAFGDVRASGSSKHWQLSLCAKLQLCFTNLQQVSAVGQKKGTITSLEMASLSMCHTGLHLDNMSVTSRLRCPSFEVLCCQTRFFPNMLSKLDTGLTLSNGCYCCLWHQHLTHRMILSY